MDLEQLGYFIFMDECEKQKKKQEQEQQKETEAAKQKQIWQDCKPPKTGIENEKNFCPVIRPAPQQSKKILFFRTKWFNSNSSFFNNNTRLIVDLNLFSIDTARSLAVSIFLTVYCQI